jgi:large repetitive protein
MDLSATPVRWQATEPLQLKSSGSSAVVVGAAAGEATVTARALRQTVTLQTAVTAPKVVPSQPVTAQLAPTGLTLARGDRAMRAPPGGAATSTPPPSPPSSAKITAFSPREGRAGDRVIISGSGFSNPNPAVDFANGTNVAANQVVDGPGTLINAYVPPGNVTGRVMVSGVLTDFEFVELASFDPAPAMNVAPDGDVIVTGKAMQNVTEVDIGSQPAPILSQSYNRLTFKLPAALQQVQSTVHIGQASLTYRVADGGTRPAYAGPDITIQVTPAITGFEPDSGAACDVAVVLGRALINDPSPGGGTTSAIVTMGPATSPFAAGSNSRMNFTVPKSAVTGPVTVKGVNQQVTSPMPFRIVAPRPAAYLQSSGPIRVGESVRFTGRLLEVTKISFAGGVELTQGWNAMPIYNSGSCQDVLDVVVPPGAQTGPITFTNPAGSVTTGSIGVAP